MNILQKLFPTAWQPRSGDGDGYQYDLDASLRYNRFEQHTNYRPTVGGDGTIAQIGAVSGLLRQQDVFVWNQMFGKTPTGPGSTTQPVNLQWQITVPGLSKQGA